VKITREGLRRAGRRAVAMVLVLALLAFVVWVLSMAAGHAGS
jgi:hypothetical protein